MKTPPGVIGKQAEDWALAYLLEQGCTLIERNFSWRGGELDLIVQDGEYTVFVEVRFRKNTNFGLPQETLDYKKRARLIATSRIYLQNHRDAAKNPSRFDVIAITLRDAKPHVEWIRNALEG